MASTVWKGHVSFGLVSFPVRLVTAARGDSISFNQLHKTDNSRVKQVLFCQSEDKPIPRTEIVKGYEYEKDRYVVIDDEDLRKAAPTSSKVMEILEFVKMAEVDPVYLESSYYMAPDEGGEKPYTLLFGAMKESGYCGIAKITMHNREHIVVMRSAGRGMMLHTMYYKDEVRASEEFRTDSSLIKEKELEMAKMLIQAQEAAFEPGKYHDTYRANIDAMIQAKVAGQAVVEAPAPHMAPVIDIMEALRESMKLKKKPAASSATVAQEVEQPVEAEKPRATPKKRARQAG